MGASLLPEPLHRSPPEALSHVATWDVQEPGLVLISAANGAVFGALPGSGSASCKVGLSIPSHGGLGEYPLREGATVASFLDHLASTHRPLTSLSLKSLSSPVSLSETALGHLATCGLTDLELHDVSIQRAASDGFSNLMRPTTLMESQHQAQCLADSIRSRGSAMIRFALALPALRRLSLSNAAFPAADVVALGALTHLEELHLVGSMECSDTASVNAVYGKLLTSLTHLRTLVLPVVVTANPKQNPPALIRKPPRDSFDVDISHSLFSDEEGFNDGFPDVAIRYPLFPGGYQGPCRVNRTNQRSGNSSPCNNNWYSDSTFDSFLCSESTSDTVANVTEAASEQHTLVANRFASTSSLASCLTMEFVTANEDNLDMEIESPQSRKESLHVSPVAAATCHNGQTPIGFECVLNDIKILPGAAAFGSSYRFPQQLEHLEIPLCAFNAAVFHDACDAYGTSDSGSLRSLCISCAPGYSAWEGSFLNSVQDFAALARLTSLESLHLSLELEGPGAGALSRGNLRACLQQIHALTNLKELRITETRQPMCFAPRPAAAAKPTLVSYLLRPADTLQRVPVARLPMFPAGINYTDLIYTGGFLRTRTLAVAPSPALSATPSTAEISGLLVHWPRLQTLVVGCHSAVRSSADNSLKLLCSLQELMAHNEKERRERIP